MFVVQKAVGLAFAICCFSNFEFNIMYTGIFMQIPFLDAFLPMNYNLHLQFLNLAYYF